MKNKHKVEPRTQWQINSRTYCFWWDDWLGVRPLANFSDVSNRFNNTTVAQFTHNGD